MEKSESLYIFDGNVNCCSFMVSSMVVSQKTKNRTTLRSRKSTQEYMSRKNKSINLKRYMQFNVHSSTIYSSQGMEQPKCPLTEIWIHMLYIYSAILFSHKKNKILPFVATWMSQENIMLSVISQHQLSGFEIAQLKLHHFH